MTLPAANDLCGLGYGVANDGSGLLINRMKVPECYRGGHQAAWSAADTVAGRREVREVREDFGPEVLIKMG